MVLMFVWHIDDIEDVLPCIRHEDGTIAGRDLWLQVGVEGSKQEWATDQVNRRN